MSDEELYSVETKLTRGTSTDDRDTIKATVSADTLDELDEKLADVRGRLAEHAELVRSIQPNPDEERSLTDDQTELSEVNA